MKSTTYIIEITNQKNEKYLSEGRNPHTCLPPHLMSTKKFSACQIKGRGYIFKSSIIYKYLAEVIFFN